jgi:hypothetical protein
MAKPRLEIKNLCVVRIYANIEETIVATIKIEKVLGELGKILYKPMKEEQYKITFRESTIDQ